LKKGRIFLHEEDASTVIIWASPLADNRWVGRMDMTRNKERSA
jgi:hypothetical protein